MSPEVRMGNEKVSGDNYVQEIVSSMCNVRIECSVRVYEV